MIKIVIDGKKFWLPTKQSEIKWAHHLAIEDIVKRHGCSCSEASQQEILCALCGCTPEDAKKVDKDQLALIIDTHVYWRDEVRVFHWKYIKYRRRMYKSLELDDMTTDKYMELELHAMNADHEKLFMGMYSRAGFNWRSILAWFLLKNRKTFGEFPYFRIKMAEYLLVTWKRQKFEDYGLLEDELPDDQVDEEQPPASPLDSFGLYHVVLSYNDYDILRLKYWLQRPVLELFKYILYMKTLNNVRKDMEKKQGSPI